ncbi:FapA family protein [Desulfitobacterium sp. THU1]|uniref:FapA family protein n=1 Tax=Desulfitobacterium sp. THU1 TaxID=3138072 RepID=UPI00311DB158
MSEMAEKKDENLSKICSVCWKPDEKKYLITLTDAVKFVVPAPQAGTLCINGEAQQRAFKVEPIDVLEFYPTVFPGELNWDLEVRDQGFTAVARVTHQRPGYYTIPDSIEEEMTIRFDEIIVWQDAKPDGQYSNEDKLQADLLGQGIIFGVFPTVWEAITAVQGVGEVLIAQGKAPTLPVHAQIVDLITKKQTNQHEDQRVDYFASKINLIQAGQALARKIPAKLGIPGKNVYGQEIPAPMPKDFQFKLKKNVHLSEDGLEVLATIAGLPLRMDELSFGVEAVFMLNQDLDLAVGSIEFPGDVFISGDVHDGLHVYSGGKVEIRGSTSRAEIRAEKGLNIYRNVLAGKLVVGARFVVRSKLLKDMQALYDDLNACLLVTIDFMKSPQAKTLREGQSLKVIIERRFPDLPKKANDFERFLLSTKDEMITQELIVFARTTKRFLTGLGPLEPQALPLLGRVNQAFKQLIDSMAFEIPEKLDCNVDYVQGAVVECAGDFVCRKGSYNSVIQAAGDLRIEGVCRGGKIIAGGNVVIKELGGSGVSTTTVQFPGTKRLKVGYCHANVTVIVDKEIISMEEPYKSLEIYREEGRVQIERLKG